MAFIEVKKLCKTYQMGEVNTLEDQMIKFLKEDADQNYGQK